MRGFNLPSPPIDGAFAISAETRREAWAIAIEQARTLDACLRLQVRLYHALELCRDRELPCDTIREALIACANRSAELVRERIASAAPPPDRRRPFAGIVFSL